MYQKIEECPICNHGLFDNYLICKDHSVSGESFAIVECQNCSFRFTNPRPGLDSVITYYQSDSYVSITNKANNLTNLLYKMARFFTIRSKTRLIDSLSKVGTILDIGCGTGSFLKGCQTKGWNIVGVEPSSAREQAIEITKSTIHHNIEMLPPKDKYDIITMWHVLEHVPDLENTMSVLQNTLKKKGRLLIAVPNHQSWDAHYYKEYWAGYDVPRHLSHFTQKTMKKLCSLNNLKIDTTIPMKLDSFYVSLLSEKYQNGSDHTRFPSYPRALINGIKSNTWGRKNNNNYSSLIYVIKKK